MNLVRSFFHKFSALFFKFWKRAGETSPPSSYAPDFEVLLEKQHDFSIHQRNLQVLITEIYKIVNEIAPPITNFLFTFRLNQHNLINFQELSTENKNTDLWAKLPSEYKLARSLTAFKSKIKSWECEICTCRLCKKYQPSLGYI